MRIIQFENDYAIYGVDADKVRTYALIKQYSDNKEHNPVLMIDFVDGTTKNYSGIVATFIHKLIKECG